MHTGLDSQLKGGVFSHLLFVITQSVPDGCPVVIRMPVISFGFPVLKIRFR